MLEPALDSGKRERGKGVAVDMRELPDEGQERHSGQRPAIGQPILQSRQQGHRRVAMRVPVARVCIFVQIEV